MTSRRLGWAWILACLLGFGALAWAWVRHAAHGTPIEWPAARAGVLAAGAMLVAIVGLYGREDRQASLAVASVALLPPRRWTARLVMADVPLALRVVTVVLLAVALARPTTYRTVERTVDTVDIVIVLDLSRSMEAEDLPRNRLDAAQRVIRNFIAKNEADRIGLVVFANEAMLQCPLTQDRRLLDRVVSRLEIGDVMAYGTAIGDGLGLGLAQLKRSDAKTKIAILLSDGDSNVADVLEPDEAAAAARTLGVQVFTVLIGREGADSEMPADPETLRSIAHATGGLFFRAEDAAGFERGFAQFRDTVEKTKRVIKERELDRDLYLILVGSAAGLLALELLLGAVVLRRMA